MYDTESTPKTKLTFPSLSVKELLQHNGPAPRLYLVRDTGVYLITEDRQRLCCADGLSPDNDNWFEESAEAVGFGDFVEPIEIPETLTHCINAGSDLVIDYDPSRNHYSVEVAPIPVSSNLIKFHQRGLGYVVGSLMSETPTTHDEEIYQSVVSMVDQMIREGRLHEVHAAMHKAFPEYYRADPPMPPLSHN